MSDTLLNKVIICKYLGPTNTKGARIKVYTQDNDAKTFPFDSSYNDDVAYLNVAREYADIWDWQAFDLIGGFTDNGAVFVLRRK